MDSLARWKTVALAAVAVIAPCNGALAQAAAAAGTAFTIANGGIEVGLTVSDLERSKSFYGAVLGLRPVATDGPAATATYAAGASTIALHAPKPTPPRGSAGVMNVNGYRLMTILVHGPQAVRTRFESAGLQAPAFAAVAGPEKYELAFVADPDGNMIELVALEPPAATTGFQIGLTVSDAAAARRFYGEMLGLIERPAMPLPATIAKDTTQYTYRADTAMIKFWAPPGVREAPRSDDAALGIRYISFAVDDLIGIRDALRARGADIVDAPDGIGNARLVLHDPDGNRVRIVAANRSKDPRSP